MIASMYALSNQLVPLEEIAMEQVQNGQQSAAIDYVYGNEYNASLTQINALKEQFLEHLDQRALAEVQSLGWTSTMIRVLMVVTLLIVGVLQAFSMRVIRKRILTPVIAVRDQFPRETSPPASLGSLTPLRSACWSTPSMRPRAS